MILATKSLIIEQAYEKIKKYKPEDAVFKKISLGQLSKQDLLNIINLDDYKRIENKLTRPVRPQKKSNSKTLCSNFDYKVALIQYLKQWVFLFSDADIVSTPIMETIVNYLEAQEKK